MYHYILISLILRRTNSQTPKTTRGGCHELHGTASLLSTLAYTGAEVNAEGRLNGNGKSEFRANSCRVGWPQRSQQEVGTCPPANDVPPAGKVPVDDPRHCSPPNGDCKRGEDAVIYSTSYRLPRRVPPRSGKERDGRRRRVLTLLYNGEVTRHDRDESWAPECGAL
jgi:hypothetical protein